MEILHGTDWRVQGVSLDRKLTIAKTCRNLVGLCGLEATARLDKAYLEVME